MSLYEIDLGFQDRIINRFIFDIFCNCHDTNYVGNLVNCINKGAADVIVDDNISSAFIDAINQIAHIIGIVTIAEYVENETIYNAILKTKVDFVQGHFISQPQPFSNFK